VFKLIEMNNFNTSYFLSHSNITINNEKKVTRGLEFILSHLNKPNWPRTISTELTGGRQFTRYSKLETLSDFKDSNYVDCRISAYNSDCDSESKTVDFIMIDLDKSNFKSKQELDRAKNKTLSKISETFQIHKFKPSVIWSGNGYHLYLPVDSQCKILEQMPKFKKLSKNPSKEFLRYAEWYLSNGKCDNEHNKTVSFNNCMLRIPGTFNSKNNAQVKIIQKWDGKNSNKVLAHLLYDRFLAYLENKNKNSAKHRSKTHTFLSENGSLSQLSVLQRFMQRRNNNGRIEWIERLLKTPILDKRKYSIWRILAPYLINVRHLSIEESYEIIEKWLDKCNDLKPLDFYPETKVNGDLNNAVGKGYLPISLDNPEKEPNTLKTENVALYNYIKIKG
jgi:Primase X